MPTSPLEGRLLTGRTWGANATIDAAFSRDFVLNNACHFADEYAQVRVAFTKTSLTFDDTEHYPEVDVEDNDEWHYVYSFGQWPLALRADGSGYRMRVRLGGECPNDSAPASRTYRLVVCPASLHSSLYQAPADFVYETTVANNTTAWMTGTSQGSLALTTQVHIGAELAATWAATTATLTGISGTEVGVSQVIVGAHVYAKQSNMATPTGRQIQVVGCYVAEWVGP